MICLLIVDAHWTVCLSVCLSVSGLVHFSDYTPEHSSQVVATKGVPVLSYGNQC